MRRDWFRHRVFQPAVEAAGLDWRPRVHDLRHASASWALAGGATVQQVREHLGHISLRAVERYLHNLPGAEAGAAGAIARVKATGALYPVITPSYTPVPALPEEVASVATPRPVDHTPDDVRAAQQQPAFTASAVRSQRQARSNGAIEPSAAPIVLELTVTVAERTTASTGNASAVTRIVDGVTTECAEIAVTIDESDEPESASADATIAPDHIDSAAAAVSPVEQSIEAPQDEQRHRDTRSHQRSKNKRHGKRPHGGRSHAQDRYTDDRHDTDERTTPDFGDRHRSALAPARRERPLSHPRLNTTTPRAVSADKSSRAADGPGEPAARGTLAGPVNQPSRETEKCSSGSDPLTSGEQKIKKPVPSTSGDRL
jgi:hypothetical protein